MAQPTKNEDRRARWLIATLVLCSLAAGCGSSVDTSTQAICRHFVKIAKVDFRDLSEGELDEGCRMQVDEVRAAASEAEFTVFASCMLKLERAVDLRACAKPIKETLSTERIRQQRAELSAAESELDKARALNETLQNDLEDLNREMEKAQKVIDSAGALAGERENAQRRLRELVSRAKATRDRIRGVKEPAKSDNTIKINPRCITEPNHPDC